MNPKDDRAKPGSYPLGHIPSAPGSVPHASGPPMKPWELVQGLAMCIGFGVMFCALMAALLWVAEWFLRLF